MLPAADDNDARSASYGIWVNATDAKKNEEKNLMDIVMIFSANF